MRPLTATQRAGMRATTEATFEGAGVRRRYPLVEDRYGNEKPNLAAPDDMAIPNLVLWQTDGSETTQDRDTQIADWLARVPVGTDITGRDLLIVAGTTYEVVGPPANVGTHLRLRLRHVDG